MSEKANAIIESAIAALRTEAAEIEGKISALEGALRKGAPRAPRKAASPAPSPKKKAAPTNGRRKKAKAAPKKRAAAPVSKNEKIKEAANKRAASWTPEKKKAAAERMRKYWADRKKGK